MGNRINHKMINEAIQLDRISYDDIYQLPVETCYDFFAANSDIYIMALDDESDDVIGYINFSPVKKSVFNQMVSGSAIDTVITGDDILPYRDGDVYWGYFSSIVVHPAYRCHGIATQMLLNWADLVYRLASEHNIYFKRIVADAVSDVGAHLLAEIGFSLIRLSEHKSKIMTLDLVRRNYFHPKFSDKLLSIHKKYEEKAGTGNGI